MLRTLISAALLLLSGAPALCQSAVTSTSTAPKADTVPIATQWVLDAVGPTGRTAVHSVYLIVCTKTDTKGTAFLLNTGVIVTNEHVVHGCSAADLSLKSSRGAAIHVRTLRTDTASDLAAISPVEKVSGGLSLASTSAVDVGAIVRTWGYPLMYNGPAPLLSVGYLAGFRAQLVERHTPVKRLVVNGAFNGGNSGGPLLSSDNKVIGVVVMKALPILDISAQNALKAFANNQDGYTYKRIDPSGNEVDVSDAQMIAMIVESLRQSAQVMIGEAVAVEELSSFLAASPAAP